MKRKTETTTITIALSTPLRSTHRIIAACSITLKVCCVRDGHMSVAFAIVGFTKCLRHSNVIHLFLHSDARRTIEQMAKWDRVRTIAKSHFALFCQIGSNTHCFVFANFFFFSLLLFESFNLHVLYYACVCVVEKTWIFVDICLN